MPISPSDAKAKKRSSVMQQDIERAQALIDEYLVDTSWPAYWDCRDLPSEVITEIIEIYTKVGWKVTYVGDFRDGDCLKFEGP